jgi:tetratricopeptide (TPR) repeat protein
MQPRTASERRGTRGAGRIVRLPSGVLAMSRFTRLAMLLLLAATALGALAQSETEAFGLAAGQHAVGFRLLEDDDGSRVVTGGATGATHARPIRTYLWYPAAAARRAEPLTFARYATLADGDIWPEEIVGDMRAHLRYANGPLARSMSAADFTALLARPMRAVEGGEPLAGPFPLIVIGLGLYYESPITFATTAEYLAGRGFTVATAPLVGTHTAIARLVVPDLETQIRDLEFVIARARQFSFVDSQRLGVIGFDQGGMAGVVLAMRNRDVDAFVSLDSGIQYAHDSGLPRSSPHYDPLALRVPWLHAGVERNQQAVAANAKSLHDEAVHADRYWLRVFGMGHEDFTSYGLVAGRGAAAGYWGPASRERAAQHRAITEYVWHFLNAHMNGSDVSMALLDQALRDLPPDAGLTLEFRAAAPAAIDYDTLVRKLIDGRGDEAIAELRSLAASSPSDALLTQTSLGRLCISLLYTWNLAEQALPLAELSLELYPTSGGAKSLLADTHAALGNYRAAIALYEDLVAQFPDAPGLRSQLEALRNRVDGG